MRPAGRRLLLSRQQERKGMARFGGSQNSRSGAGWSRKNDGRTSTELVEFKRTDNRRSITLLYDDLHALYLHAVAECRRAVLCFELGGDSFVVLPEHEYHQLVFHRQASDPAGDLPARATSPGRLRARQVQRSARKPLLSRSPAQQHSGAGSEERMPGNPPGAPRPLPGPGGLSDLRHRQRGAVGSLGRNQRKGATADRQGTTPELP
jgi:hypothetical protein